MMTSADAATVASSLVLPLVCVCVRFAFSPLVDEDGEEKEPMISEAFGQTPPFVPLVLSFCRRVDRLSQRLSFAEGMKIRGSKNDTNTLAKANKVVR